MNDVERLLSDTADYFEAQLAQKPNVRSELARLLAQGQQPQVLRELQGSGELFIATAGKGGIQKLIDC